MPAQITLAAESGRAHGSAASRRLRAEGKVPGVVYGHGMAPIAVAVDRRELRHAISGPAGANAVIRLTFEGQTQPTVIKELQRHPVKRTVTHIDFQVVSMNEEITLEVPIELEGEPTNVTREGGIIEHGLTTLTVKTTPANIPSHLTVDVSGLDVGDVVRISDLLLPSGVTTDLDPDTPVVIAAGAQKAPEEGGAEEAGEPELVGDGDTE